MLRNLAINQTMTSHILFDDVDLLPMPGLYQLLLNELKSNPQRNNKTVRQANNVQLSTSVT